jgi:hypothetical protein
MKSSNRILLSSVLLVGLVSCSYAKTYTYRDLLLKLTDLECLSVLPDSGEKTALWSSYSRASRYDSVSNTYVDWDANGDCCGFIRTEAEGQVLAEIQGPGVIWRMWSATPDTGHLQIYLDSAATPVIDLPFNQYFKNARHWPNLAYVAARGNNNYIPIPFQKSCKVVGTPGWGMFYYINHTTYPAGTVLPTFTGFSSADSALLDSINLVLGNNGNDPAGHRAGEQTEVRNLTIKANDSVVVWQGEGEGAITAIKTQFPAIPPISLPYTYLLRALAIKIYWDGETTPSVWSPIGDFFGTAAAYNNYRSLLTGMTDTNAYAYWYMPFRNGARLVLKNNGGVACSLQISVTYAPLSRPIAGLSRFHAKWHRNEFLPTDPARSIDWTLLTTQGRGRFCGTLLHVYNTSRSWWGEGDEKFFTDDEKFPSIFGTGSEDYFGYAWTNTKLFSRSYHGQTLCDVSGNVSLNRWHISDNIPFQSAFAGYIEKYFSETTARYATTVFWYLNEGGIDPYQVEYSLSDRFTYFMPIPSIDGRPKYYWKLDESDDTIAVDSSGNGNTGTVHGGAVFEPGKFGNCITLNGVNGFISTALQQSILPGSFTLALWFKTTSTTGGRLISYGNPQIKYDCDREIYMTDSGTLTFWADNSDDVRNFVVDTIKVNDGQWHHVTGVFGSGGLSLYVDGALKGTKAVARGKGLAKGYWYLGYTSYYFSWTNTTSAYFKGSLDDVRIYDRALSQPEIDAIMNGSLTAVEGLKFDAQEELDLVLSPNPFNPNLELRISGIRGNGSLKIFGVDGRLVVDLSPKLGGANLAESRTLLWSGSVYASGVYVVMLQDGKRRLNKKIMLMR